MKFNYYGIIMMHQIIADNNGIKVHYKDDVIKGIIAAMYQSYGGIDLHPDIYEKGAILFEHIIRFHPFLDGNKRTAMLSLVLYLRMENINFISFPSDVRFAVSIAQNCKSSHEDITKLMENIQRWIRFHCARAADKKEINRIIDRNIKILEKVKEISIQRNKPDILSRSVYYWHAGEIYPDINRNYEDFITESYKLKELVDKI